MKRKWICGVVFLAMVLSPWAWASEPEPMAPSVVEASKELNLQLSFMCPQIQRNGQSLSCAEVENLMEPNPEAQALFRTYRRQRLAGYIVEGGTLALLGGYYSVNAYGGREGVGVWKNAVAALVCGGIVSAVVLSVLERRNLEKSVILYNLSLKRQSSQPSDLVFSLTGNGVKVEF